MIEDELTLITSDWMIAGKLEEFLPVFCKHGVKFVTLTDLLLDEQLEVWGRPVLHQQQK